MPRVSGYRDLDGSAVAAINSNKVMEEQVLRQLDDLAAAEFTDKRWVAIARTQIEQGFMAMNRAIAQPQRLDDEACGAAIRASMEALS